MSFFKHKFVIQPHAQNISTKRRNRRAKRQTKEGSASPGEGSCTSLDESIWMMKKGVLQLSSGTTAMQLLKTACFSLVSEEMARGQRKGKGKDNGEGY
eukprot:4790495-Amphidinium_carterae.1